MKEGNIKSIPVINITDGMQIIIDGYIRNISRYEDGKIWLFTNENDELGYYDLNRVKTLVVEYKDYFPANIKSGETPLLDKSNDLYYVVRQFPLSNSQWNYAMSNNLINTNNPVEFKIRLINAMGRDITEGGINMNTYTTTWTAILDATETKKVSIDTNTIELLKEDLESIHMYLDALLIPRTDDNNETYSIVGRIKQLQLNHLNELSTLETFYINGNWLKDQVNNYPRIIVNGRKELFTDKTISYRQLARLAFDEEKYGNHDLYYVSFINGDLTRPEGTLISGDEISIHPGMIFHVTMTSKGEY